MDKSYTIKELEDIWSCSYPVADKKVKQNNFDSTELILNGRKIKSYFIADDKLYQIKQEIEDNKKVFQKKEVDNQHLNSSNEVINQSYEGLNEYSKPVHDVSFAMEIMREFKDSLISINQVNNEQLININQAYNQQLLEREKKLLLLEDSESRTKREYLETQAENKQLKEKLESFNKLEYDYKTALEKISILEAENQQLKQKTFFGIKLGK